MWSNGAFGSKGASLESLPSTYLILPVHPRESHNRKKDWEFMTNSCRQGSERAPEMPKPIAIMYSFQARVTMCLCTRSWWRVAMGPPLLLEPLLASASSASLTREWRVQVGSAMFLL